MKLSQMMNRPISYSLAILIVWGICTEVNAVVLVNDTWQDGERATPAAPTYSENGVNSDPGEDTDLESAWFDGGGGTLEPVGPGGPMRGEMEIDGGSSSWTTYFTPEASPVTLSNPGDQLLLRWDFRLSGVPVDMNTSQNLRVAIVDSPADSRLEGNGSPGSGTYTGYAIFGNIGPTLNRNDPFELMHRTDPNTSSAFLSSSGSWTSLEVMDGTNGNTGYADATSYTFIFSATRNESNGIDIITSITGGSLNGDGDLTIMYTDVAPPSFTFDTFGLRPSSEATTADIFDTSLFRVEFNTSGGPGVLEGDYNNDGIVDAADYTVWRDNLGNVSEASINNAGNGTDGVDAGDYTWWKARFGNQSSGGGGLAGSNVPEPSSFFLIVAATCLTVGIRTRDYRTERAE